MMNPFTLKRLQAMTLSSFMMLAAAGCGGETAPDEQPVVDDPQAEEAWDAEQQATVGSTVLGAYLFTKETFNGNGRTCSTCHTLTTGGLSPEQAKAIYAKNKKDPLFRAIDSDDGTGASYSKLLNDATVTVDIALPPNVRLAGSTARTVKLRRGIPSTLDSPRFDPTIMWDGREGTLQNQALHAIQGHAQATKAPTQAELNAVVDFEKALFSSKQMLDYAVTGKAPALPAGKTDAEKRGKAWFAETGVCGSCHFGALLNQTSTFNPMGVPAGFHFGSAGVSEVNLAQNPAKEFIVTNPDGTEAHVVSPDPGLMLVTGAPQMANLFKMVSLRNLKNTAPYFHDNSAKTIDQVMVQYGILLDVIGIPHTQQDLADMAAYMKLL